MKSYIALGKLIKLLAQEKNLNSASKVANWIIVDILKYLY